MWKRAWMVPGLDAPPRERDQARRAYRKLMLKIHPDKYRGAESKLPAELYEEAAKLAGDAIREYEEDGRGALAPQ